MQKKKKKNTERLKFKDFNIYPNILHVDSDADFTVAKRYFGTINVTAGMISL